MTTRPSKRILAARVSTCFLTIRVMTRMRLYLFDNNGRASAKEQLMGDIPRLVTDAGDAMSVTGFYESIYTSHRPTLMMFMQQSSRIRILR